MARVFITGSSDSLGLMAAKLLIEQGHDVVLHGRNDQRCRDALAAAPGAKDAVLGDFSTIAGAKSVADKVNKLPFNAAIQTRGSVIASSGGLRRRAACRAYSLSMYWRHTF